MTITARVPQIAPDAEPILRTPLFRAPVANFFAGAPATTKEP